MGHDYAHCNDFTDDCPKERFRAQLVRDLENIPIWYRVSYTHFKGTEERKRKETRDD